MAVITDCPAPESVKIEVRTGSSVVRWTSPPGHEEKVSVTGYEVRLEYFDPHGPMIEPFWATEQKVGPQDTAKEFQHPEEARCPGGLRACTARATVTAIGRKLSTGGATTIQTTWDTQKNGSDGDKGNLNGHKAKLIESLWEYSNTRGRHQVNVLVVGGQHHGKSSTLNHIWRCARGEADVPDQMETAPAGPSENTYATKSLLVQFGQFHIRFIDTPAFATMVAETGEALAALLAHGLADGVRRRDFANAGSLLSKPPDAAIVVVSLTHWVSMKSELQEYLKSLANKFKNASQGRVAFPYAVAVTKRDEFLRETQKPRPYEALREIVEEIKESANTSNVHVLTNMTESSCWSDEVNEATFRLLRDVVTFAANTDTAGDYKTRLPWDWIGAMALLFFGMIIGAANGKGRRAAKANGKGR